MKRVILLLSVAVMLLSLCACSKENDELSPGAVGNARESLSLMCSSLSAQNTVFDTDITSYELYSKVPDKPEDATNSYNKACDTYDEILAEIKEIIAECRKNPKYFTVQTHTFIDALENIYIDSILIAEKTSVYDREAYVQVMGDLHDSVFDWLNTTDIEIMLRNQSIYIDSQA